MTNFIRKDWHDAPPTWKIGDPLPAGATPLDDAALTDLEQRIYDAVAALSARVDVIEGTSIVLTDPGEAAPDITLFQEDDLWIEVLS